MFSRRDYERMLQFSESVRPFKLSCVFQNAGARYDDIGRHNGRGEQGAGRKKSALIFRKAADWWVVKTVKPKD
jgi:hypothetical protein